MTYCDVATHEEYTKLRATYKGLAEVFDVMISNGVAENRVKREAWVIKEAILALPLVDGAYEKELSSLFQDRIKRLESKIAEYEQKIQGIPQLRQELEAQIKDYEGKNWRLDDTRKRQKEEREHLEKWEKHLEDLEKEILSIESSEMRDRVRLAELYLQHVDMDNEYLEKAIAWSLGAIYSGGQIPDFSKKK